jgi:hypothetical protein
VLDKAGLTSLTAQVLAAITEGRVTETSVAPGTTIQWMALRRAGRPDIVSDAVWAGTAPFEGFAFSIDDGLKRYNFVVPKACGNLALVSVTVVPLPECVHVASSRSCESKQVTFTASGTAIATRQATKVSVYRDQRGEAFIMVGSLRRGARDCRHLRRRADLVRRPAGGDPCEGRSPTW